MSAIAADLLEIVEAVKIHSTNSFSISDDVFHVPMDRGGNGGMAPSLANALYQRMYCRPQRQYSEPVGIDPRAGRLFVDELSSANCGNGTWEPGWAVKALEPDGTLVVHKERDDLTLWAHPEQFRPSEESVRIGARGRLRLPKELRAMLPGYYMMLGDADQADDDAERPLALVRFYWHLTAEASPHWVHEITHRLNGASIPFRAKVLDSPGTYFRADAGVLYVRLQYLTAAMAILRHIHAAISSHLRQVSPMFTKRLARGLSVAEDPGDGRSFGQHRCQLVSEGLLRAFERRQITSLEAAAAVEERFAADRLDIRRPWLSPGSHQRYALPALRASA